MPHEPKKRHSRARQGKRRNSIHLQMEQSVVCSNCHARHASHIICPQCGFYDGKEVIAKKVVKPVQTTEEA